MSRSKFKVEGRLDGSQGGTVTIDRSLGLISVRPLRRKREYTLPLKDVAEMVVLRVVRAEIQEKTRK